MTLTHSRASDIAQLMQGITACALIPEIVRRGFQELLVASSLGRRGDDFLEAALGITQVARDSGLSRGSLYKALSGERSPSFDTILKVVTALGLKLTASARNGAEQLEFEDEAELRKRCLWRCDTFEQAPGVDRPP